MIGDAAHNDSVAARGTSPAVYATLALVLAGTLVLHLSTWEELTSRWLRGSETYSHGFLIVAISLWLVLRQVDVLRWPPAGGRERLALLVVAGASLLWLVGRMSNVFVAQAVALPVMILAAITAVLGAHAIRHMVFPIAFLYFAIPIWEVLLGTLQATTIAVVSWFLGVVMRIELTPAGCVLLCIDGETL